MILVDSSVWIDFFRGTVTPQVDVLDRFLGEELVAIGDLMMTEVLQGFASERDFNKARRMLGALDLVEIGGRDVMIEAARYFRDLRARGITIRKTIDTLIATRCIVSGYRLLYSDRDFDPFVTHLGLERVV
ncbi:PilT protein domain-containing protein [Acetobacter pasteurianus NBRC 3280]|uniref:Ribonuclease VapC n=1 Tax=Acetobacter pasteurianus NBRC 3278 TaxID=1226660 RepID=A0A401X918_ACEPA|nr:PIN domain nuclease [Acetobacter pasteurianus]GCD60474.1 PilT protein domain-containing protein [Acetobacter pasteurianus NBRC 3277]GCD64227.1 PilT protein domain-containing protein [Acetobacter pasteurianus NBRC 3278]GCD69999.1 PilT protein domain-containing protein [Acetobacter pasteurianus NBRC 3280]